MGKISFVLFFKILRFIFIFSFFGLFWVFLAVYGLSLVAACRLSLVVLRGLLLLHSVGSRHMVFGN